MKQFQAAARRSDPIEFDLAGDVFHWTPQKIAGPALALLTPTDMLEVEALRANMDWLGSGLAEGEEDKLIARLEDPSDALDIPLLFEVVQWLMEETSGFPTQLSSASPRSGGDTG